MASKLKYRGRKSTKARHIVGYFTKVEMIDGSEVFIGASAKAKVETIWRRISMIPFDISKVSKCRVFKHS